MLPLPRQRCGETIEVQRHSGAGFFESTEIFQTKPILYACILNGQMLYRTFKKEIKVGIQTDTTIFKQYPETPEYAHFPHRAYHNEVLGIMFLEAVLFYMSQIFFGNIN